MRYNIGMFKQTTATYRQLKPGDDDFSFSPDGIVTVNRAGFEISLDCPRSYQEIILECIRNGWLNPIAYMRDTEYTMELLRK